MNKEVIKAMSRKESKRAIRNWWRKNGYKVLRIVLFPVWIGIETADRLNHYLNSRTEWSEERANEILSYYIPRKAKWDAETKEFYFADNGIGWGMKTHQKKLKIKDRRWWNKYTRPWGGMVRTYLIEKFELEGFEKVVGDTFDGWTEVTFKLTEE